ncbi:MAG: hypothetical protein FJ144_12720 [Deltaproteobacteria bacterium]|nr:hypothetical protein [Deltaproteobacteria bacterium]
MRRRRAFLARLLGRSRGRGSRAGERGPAAPLAPPGPREDHWLVVATGEAVTSRRSVRIAEALARTGAPVAWAGRVATNARGSFEAPAGPVQVIDSWSVASLRLRVAATDARVRLLLAGADGETVAIAREGRARGARIAYDASLTPGRGTYEIETERALVSDADDLIAADVRLARHLSGLAGGRRLVHVLGDPGGDPDGDGWDSIARSLVTIGAAPTTTVVFAAASAPDATVATVEAFVAARVDTAHRIAVVIGADDPVDEKLAARESSGEIQILRSARPGRLAAWNLGVVATGGEIVVLADSSVRPRASGWLDAAVARLRAHREIGAVGLRALRPPGAGSSGLDGRDAGSRVAALDASGLVAPRAVLARCGGFDEDLTFDRLAAVDLSFRIRELGLRVDVCDALGLEAVAAPAEIELDRRAEKAWRARWAHRPAYLAGDATPEV